MNTITPSTFDIGSLRSRVRIQRDVGQQSASGAPQPNWVDVISTADACVWAHIEDAAGREIFAAEQIYPETRTTITMRYVPGLDESMRVLWHDPRTQKDVQFDILHISDLEGNRHHILELDCLQRPSERNV